VNGGPGGWYDADLTEVSPRLVYGAGLLIPLGLMVPRGFKSHRLRHSSRGVSFRVVAPVAQQDRASDYGSEGREFESSRAHQDTEWERAISMDQNAATLR
jgi:hypothetical protein